MDDVLVAVGGVEGVVLLGAEAEEHVALEHVDPQGVHRRYHRVDADVELGNGMQAYCQSNVNNVLLTSKSEAAHVEMAPSAAVSQQ